MKKTVSVRVLQWFYVFVLITILTTVYIIHSTERPFLDVLRLPTFFRATENITGITYNQFLTLYHFTFAYFLSIIVIDIISLFFYSNRFLRKISLFSSFLGFFVLGIMVAYFLYSVFLLGPPVDTASTSANFFLLFSLLFFTLDLFTFLIEQRGIYTLD